MATIRFTSAERPLLLANAVAGHGVENKLGRALFDLADALREGDTARFDEVLVAEFPLLAVKAAGLPTPEEGA